MPFISLLGRIARLCEESQVNSSIQPIKLARKEGEVRFNWKVSDFQRLTESLLNDTGTIEVVIEGYFDDRRRCLLNTSIRSEVTLECQTTFEPIVYPIDRKVIFCAVSAESQIAEVDDEFEAVLMDDGFLDVAQAIEDELILSIPIVANKPIDEINKSMSFGELDEAAIAAEKAAKNPFAVLKDLKKP